SGIGMPDWTWRSKARIATRPCSMRSGGRLPGAVCGTLDQAGHLRHDLLSALPLLRLPLDAGCDVQTTEWTESLLIANESLTATTQYQFVLVGRVPRLA